MLKFDDEITIKILLFNDGININRPIFRLKSIIIITDLRTPPVGGLITDIAPPISHLIKRLICETIEHKLKRSDRLAAKTPETIKSVSRVWFPS